MEKKEILNLNSIPLNVYLNYYILMALLFPCTELRSARDTGEITLLGP